MLTAGARPKSRTNFDRKELALFLVVGLFVVFPLRLGAEWMLDRAQMSLFNAATIEAILIFCPVALVLRSIPWRDPALRAYAANFVYINALLGVLNSGRHRNYLDLWPAVLVTVLMFLAVRKWERERESGEPTQGR